MIKATPRVVGRLNDGTDIIEIYCPVCNCDRNEDCGNTYRCCRCGTEFIQDYGG